MKCNMLNFQFNGLLVIKTLYLCKIYTAEKKTLDAWFENKQTNKKPSCVIFMSKWWKCLDMSLIGEYSNLVKSERQKLNFTTVRLHVAPDFRVIFIVWIKRIRHSYDKAAEDQTEYEFHKIALFPQQHQKLIEMPMKLYFLSTHW